MFCWLVWGRSHEEKITIKWCHCFKRFGSHWIKTPVQKKVQVNNPQIVKIICVALRFCNFHYHSMQFYISLNLQYLSLQLWTPPLAWTSPTFAPTPSPFTGWLQLLLSPATASATRRRAAGGPRMRGCPQPGPISL